jgi:hypothetical protein
MRINSNENLFFSSSIKSIDWCILSPLIVDIDAMEGKDVELKR